MYHNPRCIVLWNMCPFKRGPFNGKISQLSFSVPVWPQLDSLPSAFFQRWSAAIAEAQGNWNFIVQDGQVTRKVHFTIFGLVFAEGKGDSFLRGYKLPCVKVMFSLSIKAPWQHTLLHFWSKSNFTETEFRYQIPNQYAKSFKMRYYLLYEFCNPFLL